jgi:Flp pilus assembly pilin Flp
MTTVARFWKEEEGQDLIEYVLLVALIALAGLVAFPALSTSISNAFSHANTCLTTQANC